MTRPACAALLLLACAACTADRAMERAAASIVNDSAALAAADSAEVPEPPLPEPVPEADAAYLVWSADSAGMTETVWIDGAGEAVARRPGVFVAAGGGLWAWRERQERIVATNCECYARNEYDPEAHCPRPARVAVVDFVDLLGGRRVPVLGVQDGISVAPPEQVAVPYTGVGPYLFAENDTQWYDCYRHYGDAVEPVVLDLSRGGNAEASLVDSAEAEAIVAAQGAEAREEMLREFEASSLDTTEVPASPPSFTSVEAAWTADGRLKVSYRFHTGACFACANAHASSYSMSAAIPAASVPPKLAPYTVAPGPVRLYWRRSPPGEHAGWSRVDAPLRAPALARFRSSR